MAQKFINKKGDKRYQAKVLTIATDEEIGRGLENGTLRQVGPDLYEEVIQSERPYKAPSEYETKPMTPKKKRGRPRGSKNKPKTADK